MTEVNIKDQEEYDLVKRNAIAIGQTLEHHGKLMTELQEMIEKLRMGLTMLEQEQVLQKQMIVKSLTQKYGHGPTA